MKLTVILIFFALAFVFLALHVSAHDLSDFPVPFIKEKQFDVIGIGGNNTSDALALYDLLIGLQIDLQVPFNSKCSNESGMVCMPNDQPAVETELDATLTNSSQNIISIGGPCANNVTARIMGMPSTWPECANGFANGTGRIRIYNKWNRTQVIIAGYSAEDTEMAANVMRNYAESNLGGYELKISGETENLKVEKVIVEEEIYCRDDEDCILVIAGCRFCELCKEFVLADEEVIAVNKNVYACPSKPKGISCVGCVGVISYDLKSDAICIKGKCEKKISICPQKTHIDCMPFVREENVKYCIPRNRAWIQENCNITFTD